MSSQQKTAVAERRANLRRSTDRLETRLIRLEDVLAMCALGRTALYEAIRRDGFPRPIALFGRSKRWVYHEIQEWLIGEISKLRAAGIQSPTPPTAKTVRGNVSKIGH